MFKKKLPLEMPYNSVYLHPTNRLIIVGQRGTNKVSIKLTEDKSRVWGRINDINYSVPKDKVKYATIIVSPNTPLNVQDNVGILIQTQDIEGFKDRLQFEQNVLSL